MRLSTRRLFSSDSLYLAVVLLPIILLIALFIYYPAVDTFGQSLTNRNLRIRRPPKPVGLANYVKLAEDEEFWEVTGRSFKVVIITLPLEMVVAFGIAMLLNQRFPGRGVVRTLTFLPWMLPGVVNGFLWGWLL
ncbi:MAG: sugar ABC transporter permease, partial [Chloroflexi bacterium]|nr:sugar ABC transporter permease [Chloroflexota bacterium]